MTRPAEDKLNFLWDETTRFTLRIEYYDGGELDPSTVRFLPDIRTLDDAQTIYLRERDASGLCTSRFLPGEVFDQAPARAHIARISYDGRLWAPDPLTTGGAPIAEAPVTRDPEDNLVWMAGTRRSVLEDGFTAGPDTSPEILTHLCQETYRPI